MFVDYVYCGKCGRKLYVNIGAEHCPGCGEYGTLQWVDIDTPTIEIEHELSQRKIVAEVHVKMHNGIGVWRAVAEDETEAVENAHKAATKSGGDDVLRCHTQEIWYQEVTA